MAEYITKEAAIEAVEDAGLELYQSEWNEIEEKINAVPAADVVPVVHGRWEHDQRYESWTKHFICSECKYSAEFKHHRMPLFCPNCGAKMDGGEDNG